VAAPYRRDVVHPSDNRGGLRRPASVG